MLTIGKLRLTDVSLKTPPPLPDEPDGCDWETFPLTCSVPVKVRFATLPPATHTPPPGPLEVLFETVGLLPETVPPLVWRTLMPPPFAPWGVTTPGSVVLPVIVQLFRTRL